MKLWIVEGITGEYSDRSEWPVAAFLHEASAYQFAEECNDWLQQHGVLMNGSSRNALDYDERRALKPPFDESFRCDYTGSEYLVWSVDLRATPEEVADWSVAAKASAA